MPFDEQRSLSAPSGARLNLYIERSSVQERGVVQINHGLAEHAARYERFADFLAERGYHVYAHDHRGHGHTSAPDAPLGHFGSEPAAEKVIADVAAVHDLISAEHSGLPVVVFGHSMGGLIALDFVLQHPGRAAAAAIWNANFSARASGHMAKAILAWERLRLGSDIPSRILPRLTFGAWAVRFRDRRTDFDWLSRDPGEVDRYVADPLCGWAPSVGMWRTVFDFIFFAADDANFSRLRKDTPFQLVGGEKDPATGGGRAVRALEARMRRLGFSNLETRIYVETRHESLNEVNRGAIMQDFVRWAERALGTGKP
jgi:alpha-beta hydrolase superfamily lysophospholipase